ncbi:MAG: hypothetical protein KC731_34925, partial [Myxococcales bacterium]|nr:hypothetical protein [Myxococcales bacterium]
PMPLAHELGDAWRSWCNPNREDAREASFDVDGFAASWRGYQRGRGEPLAPAELESLVDGVAIITLELCARFAADAILEAYFGWDAQRFPGRGEHNLARARGQWALYQAVRDTRDQRRRILGC